MLNICSDECEQPAASVFLNRVLSCAVSDVMAVGRMHAVLFLCQGILFSITIDHQYILNHHDKNK